MSKGMKKHLTIRSVAAELDVSVRTVYRLIESGAIIAFPIRRKGALRVPAASLRRYVRNQILKYQLEMGIIPEKTVTDHDS